MALPLGFRPQKDRARGALGDCCSQRFVVTGTQVIAVPNDAHGLAFEQAVAATRKRFNELLIKRFVDHLTQIVEVAA